MSDICPVRGIGHWWLCDSPSKGKVTSTGRCKYCHEEREFYNDVPPFDKRFIAHIDYKIMAAEIEARDRYNLMPRW